MSIQDKAAALANKLNGIDVRYRVSPEGITAKATDSEIDFFYHLICKGVKRDV